MSKVLPYTGSVSGQGQEDLSFSWGANPTRAQRSMTYSIDGGMNSLVVSQEASPALFITTSEASKTISVSESARTISFDGTTNARYLRYAVISGGSETTVSSVTESSATGTSANVGTTYSEISSFIGGSQSYNVGVSLSVPANATTGITVTVYASDTSDGTGAVSQSFTLAVSEPVDVTSVEVDPSELVIGIGSSYRYNNQTVTVNANSRNKLSYSVTPATATIGRVNWVSGNTQIATVDSNGVVTGVANGTTYIRCEVTDTAGNTVYDHCDLTVYAEGTISVSNMTIETLAQSGSSEITTSNIDNSKALNASFSGTAPEWIQHLTVSTATSPYRVVVDCYPNSSHAQDRDATAVVTGTDMLLNTITSSGFTIHQNWETLCTAMTINGSSTIHDSGNSEDYTVSYTPVGTTQNRCVWSVSDTSIATVTEGASNNECTVTALRSGTVTLYATNYYNSSIVAHKEITITYVYPRGEINLNPTNVTLAYDATTDSTVAVTGTGISGNLTITPESGGFITGGEIVDNHLKIYFSDNSGSTSSRSCSVTVSGRDGNDDLISNTVNYTQNGRPVSSNNISIASITPSYNAHDVVNNVTVRVNFINNSTVDTVFTSVAYTMTGYTSASGGEVDFTKSDTLAARVDATAGTMPVDYTIESVGATAALARIEVTVTATNNSATLTASDTWRAS